MKSILSIGTLCVACSVLAQPANGNFEATPFDLNWTGNNYHAGAGKPGTGAGGGAGKAVCFGVPIAAPNFSGDIESDAFNCGVAGTPNEECKVTFDYWCEPTARFVVTMTNGLTSFSHLVAVRDSTWRSASITSPCGSNISITIEGAGGANGDEVCFDNFVATCVPEPFSIAALSIGVLSVFGKRRPRGV